MKTLLVLRHAKSSWGDDDLPDHDRPLNKRGRRDAPRIGKLIQDEGIVPDIILSSTAKRAATTAALVAESCGYERSIDFTPALYGISAGDCLAVVRQISDEYASAMIVAHNPGLEDLVTMLSGRYERFPTGALAQFSIGIEHWADFDDSAAATLMQVWRPKEVFP